MDISRLQICGEIYRDDRKQLSLHCLRCPVTCLDWFVFAAHVKQSHSDDEAQLEDAVSSAEDGDDEKLVEEADYSFVTITKFDGGVKQEDPSESGDPLEEHLLPENEHLEEYRADSVTPENEHGAEIDDEQDDDDKDMDDDDKDMDDDDKDMDDDDKDEDHEINEKDLDSVDEECDSDCSTSPSGEKEAIGNKSTVPFTRHILSGIIEAYSHQQILWDCSAQAKARNRKEREAALKRITAEVNEKFDCDLKTDCVRVQILKLRRKYQQDLQNDEIGSAVERSWCYDKLSFLREVIKVKASSKRASLGGGNAQKSLPIPSLSTEQNLQLIELYESYRCLWDYQHIWYRFKNQRQEALDELQQAVKRKMELDYSQSELQKQLYRLRYACSLEKYRQLESVETQQSFQPSSEVHRRLMFLEDSVGPFKCSHCELVLNGADQFRVHKSQHENTMPFTCPICQRGFMKVGNCTVHLRRHTRDYTFECEVCKKRYATSGDLNVHMRHHTGEKPYFCEICGQSFRTWTLFNGHMRRHQKQANYQCSICCKAFYENNKLHEHMKAHLNVRDKMCTVCGKAFTSSKYLRQHKQIHAEKKKYACRICYKDFAQYAGLSSHMKSHGTTVNVQKA